MPAINQALAIPLEPGRPPGAPARGPSAPAPSVDAAAKTVRDNKPNLTVPATVLPPAMSRPAPDVRRQTRLFGAPASSVMAAEGPPSTPFPPRAEGVEAPPSRAMTGWADGHATLALATSVAAR
jgi:hypothetical protein